MQIEITGVPPYDGEYPLLIERLTNRDIHTIKKIAGYTPPEYLDAVRRDDTDFVVALAIIAVRRSQRHQTVNEDAFWDAELGHIKVTDDDEQATGVPPTILAPNEPTTPSGSTSKPGSEPHQERSLRSTGTLS